MARKNNTLKSELKMWHELGFHYGNSRDLVKNPIINLEGNRTLVALAGGLISLVSTDTFFKTKQYLKTWKSSNGNLPFATMSSTQIDEDGIGRHTEIYYREIYKEEIYALARRYGCLPEQIVMDHINNIRGDNFDENLRLATPGQNNQNRSKTKVEKAFYTIEDFKHNITSGLWVLKVKK